jgi:hypothetical protein
MISYVREKLALQRQYLVKMQKIQKREQVSSRKKKKVSLNNDLFLNICCYRPSSKQYSVLMCRVSLRISKQILSMKEKNPRPYLRNYMKPTRNLRSTRIATMSLSLAIHLLSHQKHVFLLRPTSSFLKHLVTSNLNVNVPRLWFCTPQLSCEVTIRMLSAGWMTPVLSQSQSTPFETRVRPSLLVLTMTVARCLLNIRSFGFASYRQSR